MVRMKGYESHSKGGCRALTGCLQDLPARWWPPLPLPIPNLSRGENRALHNAHPQYGTIPCAPYPSPPHLFCTPPVSSQSVLQRCWWRRWGRRGRVLTPTAILQSITTQSHISCYISLICAKLSEKMIFDTCLTLCVHLFRPLPTSVYTAIPLLPCTVRAHCSPIHWQAGQYKEDTKHYSTAIAEPRRAVQRDAGRTDREKMLPPSLAL